MSGSIVGRTLHHGSFDCPVCKRTASYQLVRSQRYARIYGINLVPMTEPIDYVECLRCHSTYDRSILEVDGDAHARQGGSFKDGVLRIMAAVGLAVGEVDPCQRATMEEIYERVTGTVLDGRDLDAALVDVKRSSYRLDATLLALEPALNGEKKELLIRTAVTVAAAGGSIGKQEASVIATIASALDVTHIHLAALIADFHAPSSDGS